MLERGERVCKEGREAGGHDGERGERRTIHLPNHLPQPTPARPSAPRGSCAPAPSCGLRSAASALAAVTLRRRLSSSSASLRVRIDLRCCEAGVVQEPCTFFTASRLSSSNCAHRQVPRRRLCGSRHLRADLPTCVPPFCPGGIVAPRPPPRLRARRANLCPIDRRCLAAMSNGIARDTAERPTTWLCRPRRSASVQRTRNALYLSPCSAREDY
ncbi:hypothetical protein B0H10DRAFT_638131 [Mycena sp. CBHHK59/15]|nr:hypothetical protein B0H10DRAFT_638131 [Mycena sp. CBHHK59/15]